MLMNVEQSLAYYTRRSTAIHLVLILIIAAFSGKLWLDKKRITEGNIKLVKSSVRVDIVAMPKFTLKELKTLNQQNTATVEEVEVKAAPVVESNETSKVEFNKAKKKVSFSDLMKSISKKKVEKAKKNALLQKKGTKGAKKRKDYSKELNQLVIEGNKLSKGFSLVGNGENGENEVFGNYIRSIRDQVKENWKLPGYLLNKEFQCRVRVYISQEGKLIRAEIHESSGNQEYDQRAIAAVKSSSPFSSVDSNIETRVGRGEILLGFPL